MSVNCNEEYKNPQVSTYGALRFSGKLLNGKDIAHVERFRNNAFYGHIFAIRYILKS